MNLVVEVMIKYNIMNKTLLYLHQKVELHRYMMNMYDEALCDEYTKLETIEDAWKDDQLNDSCDWLNIPTTEEIFSRRTVDNGDRFHHFDRNGYKRSRRVGKFNMNYANAETASKRQANLDRIAQWAVLDGIKQSIIDKFIEKYDLSSEEIIRFEDVMLETYHGILLEPMNTYDDRWYVSHDARFDSHIPFERP